jgi:hypothetical protein
MKAWKRAKNGKKCIDFCFQTIISAAKFALFHDILFEMKVGFKN